MAKIIGLSKRGASRKKRWADNWKTGRHQEWINEQAFRLLASPAYFDIDIFFRKVSGFG